VGFLREMAKNLNAENKLSFASADLFQKGSFDTAFKDAQAVIHTAAVVDITNPVNAMDEVVRPSIEGAENVIEAVKKNPSVKRLVHTSSIAAILRFDEANQYTFTEKDWNTLSTADNGDAYGYAKTQAERKVWQFQSEQSVCDVVVLNPSFVWGQCLSKAHTKGSPLMLRQVIYGNPQLPFTTWAVDVEDVALAHVRALSISSEFANKRYILTCDDPPIETTALGAVAQSLFPQYVMSSPARFSPWLMNIVYYITPVLSWVPIVGSYLPGVQRHMIGKTFHFSNSASKSALGMTYTPLKTSMEKTIRTMIDSGWVKPRQAKL